MNLILKNTLKICLASILAILVAHFIGLKNEIAAGIVTILSILSTKKESWQTAISRTIAFILGLVIAFFSFEMVGYSSFGFFVFLVPYIFVCQWFGWYSSMAMNSVIISHFIPFNSMAWPFLINEVGIFFIGIGFGLLANAHLRKNKNHIQQQIQQMDDQIKGILSRMGDILLQKDKSLYQGECFIELDQIFKKAITQAQKNLDNQLFLKEEPDLNYLWMRDRQIKVLKEMYRMVLRLNQAPFTTEEVSNLWKKIAMEYHADNSVESLLVATEEVLENMKKVPLPSSREEFENRAILYILLQKMEEFLRIKNAFISRKKKINHLN